MSDSKVEATFHGGESFTCPKCGRVSHHPEDVAQGYCSNCHDWTRGE